MGGYHYAGDGGHEAGRCNHGAVVGGTSAGLGTGHPRLGLDDLRPENQVSQDFTNGQRLEWVSRKGRSRLVRIITRMKREPGPYLVQIEYGAPGEAGKYRVLPGRLFVRTSAEAVA